jgi:hypothetical protein
MNVFRIIELTIQIAILIALIFAFKVGMEEKHYYEECNIKLLCQANKLNPTYRMICQSYNYTVPELPNIG